MKMDQKKKIYWGNYKYQEREWKWSLSVLSDALRPHGRRSLRGFDVRGIFQARILEWAAISFSRGSSQPGDPIQVSCIADRHFTVWATREAPYKYQEVTQN